MNILVLFLLLIILVLLSVPIGVAIGLSTMVTIALFTDVPLMVVAEQAFESLDSFPLMAILFFTLAGILMGKGKTSERLLEFADSLVGFIVGGLSVVTVLASMFFSAISGSGPATVAAVGSIMIPAMKEKGYGENFSAALTAAAGSTGPIIPPSISFIILGVTAGISISDLFLAGIMPGILIGLALMLFSYFKIKLQQTNPSSEDDYKERFNIKDLGHKFRRALLALFSPIIILGGIYSGIFTATEASAVAVAYALLLEILVYREIGWKGIYDSFVETLKITGAILYLIGLSTAFAYLLTTENIPATLANAMVDITSSTLVIMILINIFLLLVGSIIETVAAIVVLSPILFPVITNIGLDPLHFGIIMILNLTIGYITPPMGQNLFVASAIGDVSFDKIIKAVFPLFLVLLIVLVIVILIPQLSTYLPGLLNS